MSHVTVISVRPTRPCVARDMFFGQNDTYSRGDAGLPGCSRAVSESDASPFYRSFQGAHPIYPLNLLYFREAGSAAILAIMMVVMVLLLLPPRHRTSFCSVFPCHDTS